MLYIHDMSCISPQKTFGEIDLADLKLSSGNILTAIEPSYKGIPPGQLRRMGKAVRIGVGAAMAVLKDDSKIDGIIIGTANGGMEDCIKFLNQIIEYEEGVLTPTNFVQSTTNAIASQIAFMSKNKGYNITHVHRGLSFENALQDAMMHAMEDPLKTYLLGGIEEVSDYNFNIDFLLGCFKEEFADNRDLYSLKTKGTISGEAATMFIVNGVKANSLLGVKALQTFHDLNASEPGQSLLEFLHINNLSIDEIDLYISGENGDVRYDPFFSDAEKVIHPDTTIIRYKHAIGEFPSASSFAFWLACYFSEGHSIPEHMLKRIGKGRMLNNILLYNCYQGKQHSFMLLGH